MLTHYLEEIANCEFAERNREIPRLVTRILQEMNSRGIIYSTMTLDAIADFFRDEFWARCDFLKDFVTTHPSLLLSEAGKQLLTTAQTAYQERSFQEKEGMISLYSSSTARVSQQLQNEGLKGQIKTRLVQSMEDRIRTNNMYVEIACREISVSENANGGVLILQPNIAGLGIDLRQLYRRHLEPLLRRT